MSMSELHEALVFHSTMFSHLYTSHITVAIASLPDLPHLQILWRRKMPGEEASNANGVHGGV